MKLSVNKSSRAVAWRRIDLSAIAFALLLALAFFVSEPTGVLAQPERGRLETFRRQASALAQIAVMDECLLFTADQRAQLLAALDLPENDAWWRPNGGGAMLFTANSLLLDRLGDRGLGCFLISDGELARWLLPSQVALYRELRRPIAQQFVAQQRVVAHDGPKPVTVVEIRPVPRESPSQGDLQKSRVYLAHRVNMLFITCGLRGSQCQKLLLAGALDLERLRDRQPAPKPADDPPGAIVERSLVTGVPPRTPTTIFDERTSAFHKSLRRLTDEQRRLLRASEDDRRDFRRRAIVAAAVVGFVRRASLTAQRCEELSRAFNDASAAVPTVELDRECLLAMSRLREENIRPHFTDEQWPAAKQQFEQLSRMAESLKPSLAARKLVLRKVRVKTVWKNKEPWSDLQMDELELDMGAK